MKVKGKLKVSGFGYTRPSPSHAPTHLFHVESSMSRITYILATF
jgi:hypothetical protein